MSFPIQYPVVDGPGRLTEICTFRKSGIPEEEFDSVYGEITATVAKFPISRQGILGVQTADRRVVTMFADWTSAAEKDVFEPGEQYQSVKPHFGKIVDGTNPTFTCHHIILPTGAGKTPQAAAYIVSHATVPQADQARAASAYTEFVKSSPDVEFLVASPSREDSNVLVTLTGHKDAAAAAAFQQSEAYKELQAAVAKVATATSSYEVEYQSSSVY